MGTSSEEPSFAPDWVSATESHPPSREDLRPLSGAAEEKDLPVLASAVNGRPDYLVTGDKKILSLIGREGGFPFKTVSPSEFLGQVLPEILAGKTGRSA